MIIYFMSLDDKLYGKTTIQPKNPKDEIFVFEILIYNLSKKKSDFICDSDLVCDFVFSKKIYNFQGKLLNNYLVPINNMVLYHKNSNGILIKKYTNIFLDEVLKKNSMTFPNNFAQVMKSINSEILKKYN